MDICFAPFRFDVTNQQLWKGNELVPLRLQSLTVLRYLIEHCDRCVPTHELLSACWRDVQVGANNVKVCITDIRHALRDTATTPTFIETKPRHGYRFIGTVTAQSGKGDSPASPGAQDGFPPCVGRETELQLLQACLKRALTGHRQTLFVTGEPGIGKTTVVQEFLRRVVDRTDLWIISGHCREQYGIEETYQPVREGLDQLSKSCEGPALLPLLRDEAAMGGLERVRLRFGMGKEGIRRFGVVRMRNQLGDAGPGIASHRFGNGDGPLAPPDIRERQIAKMLFGPGPGR